MRHCNIPSSQCRSRNTDSRGSGAQGHAATLFPLSEAASWITGVTLDLAGGRVMGLIPGIDFKSGDLPD